MSNKSAKPKTVAPDRPWTAEEREELKTAVVGKKGNPSMYAFINLPEGRPPSKPKEKVIANELTPDEPSPKPKSAVKVNKPKATRGKYINYNESPYKEALETGVESMLLTGGNVNQATKAIAEAGHTVEIKLQTLTSRWKKAKKDLEKKADKNHENDEDLEQFASSKDMDGGMKSLTSESTRDFLQAVVRARDNANKGMARWEMINLIADLEGVSNKTADNHYCYLVRTGQLPELKRGGRVVASQATTSNRTAIATAKLLCTYNTMSLGKFYFYQFIICIIYFNGIISKNICMLR